MSKITIKDIAKIANVSVATVSRVIRNKDVVKDETRSKVIEIVEKYGYIPSATARSMVSKRFNVIGVVIADISNPFYPQVVRGIENTVRALNYSLILCNTDEIEEREDSYLRILLEKGIDGLIIMPSRPKIPLLKTYDLRNIPIVCVDRHIENINVDYVMVNNKYGAFIATELLIKNNHKRIGIVTARRSHITMKKRIEGYLEALKKYNIEADDSLIVTGEFYPDDYEKATEKLFKLNSPPTAIFSAGNLVTMSVYKCLNKLGKRIPEDIALVGFDDIPWGEALNPPLTAISQPAYQIGATAAQLILQRIKKERPRIVGYQVPASRIDNRR
jgi:LacI family transcriptional regulator